MTGPIGYGAGVRARRDGLVALGVLGALVVVGLLVVAGDDGGPEAHAPLTAERTQPPHEAAVARDGLDAAEVDVVSGATAVTVRVADLAPELVRASTPEGAQVAPVVHRDGPRVRVSLVSTGLAGPSDVTVLLDRQVRWRVRLSGGANSEFVDLRGGRVDAVDFAAGASRIELSLPEPRGAVPVRMAGGASDFTVHLPAGADAGVRVSGGAGSVQVDGVRRTGLSGGTTVRSSTATDRYDIDAVAGVSTLTVDRA